MRSFYGLVLLALGATSLFAQYRSTSGSFGNVVFPGGTSAQRGVTRSFGNVVFPGTGGPKLYTPFSITDPTFGDRLGRTVAGQNVYGQQQHLQRGHRRAVVVPYVYPIYTGGTFYDPGPAVSQQPNITVIYPPQQAPVIINQAAPLEQYQAPPADTASSGVISVYQAPTAPRAETAPAREPARYLIAFKDRTIYSAVAYWVDGETLHYFTDGSTHNQVSLSLVDRELTERLNKETGSDLRLPK